MLTIDTKMLFPYKRYNSWGGEVNNYSVTTRVKMGTEEQFFIKIYTHTRVRISSRNICSTVPICSTETTYSSVIPP